MSVNEKLLAYGNEAEEKVLEYMRSFGLDVTRRYVIPDDKKSIYENLRYGDLVLKMNDSGHVINFDVKRGLFISKKSLDSYKGAFYILIPKGDLDDIKNARVVKRSTVCNYFLQVEEGRYHKTTNGTIGYRFTKLKNYMTLEKYVVNFVKTIVIMNNDYDEYGRFLRSFNKVLPRHAQELNDTSF